MRVPVVDVVVEQLLLGFEFLEWCLNMVAIVGTDYLDVIHPDSALCPGEATVGVVTLGQSGRGED